MHEDDFDAKSDVLVAAVDLALKGMLVEARISARRSPRGRSDELFAFLLATKETTRANYFTADELKYIAEAVIDAVRVEPTWNPQTKQQGLPRLVANPFCSFNENKLTGPVRRIIKRRIATEAPKPERV